MYVHFTLFRTLYLTVSFPQHVQVLSDIRLTVSITERETIWSLERGQLNLSICYFAESFARQTKELFHRLKMVNFRPLPVSTLMRHRGVHLSAKRIWTPDREKFSSLARCWIDRVANSIVSLTRSSREIDNESRQRPGRYYVTLRLSRETKRYYAVL